MALGINTNVASLSAQNQLNRSQEQSNQALERLRIVSSCGQLSKTEALCFETGLPLRYSFTFSKQLILPFSLVQSRQGGWSCTSFSDIQ